MSFLFLFLLNEWHMLLRSLTLLRNKWLLVTFRVLNSKYNVLKLKYKKKNVASPFTKIIVSIWCGIVSPMYLSCCLALSIQEHLKYFCNQFVLLVIGFREFSKVYNMSCTCYLNLRLNWCAGMICYYIHKMAEY